MPHPTSQANLIEEPLMDMISTINLVGGSKRRRVDTATFPHVCYNRVMFKTYTAGEDKKVPLGILTPLLLLVLEMWNQSLLLKDSDSKRCNTCSKDEKESDFWFTV